MKRTESRLAAAALPVPLETIERRIYLIRSQKVMLDRDLADLYQVPTKSLNLAVRRNADRFPEDFMFQLTKEEVRSLRFQSETSNKGRGGRRYLPHAFTEHGVAMLSSVLNSKRAVQVNILIIRAFVKLREMLSTHKDLARKLEASSADLHCRSAVLQLCTTSPRGIDKYGCLPDSDHLNMEYDARCAAARSAEKPQTSKARLRYSVHAASTGWSSRSAA